MDKNNGGPAFPVPVENDIDCCGRFESGYGGMTLLDYFAAKAMQGFVMNFGIVATSQGPSDDDIARYSYDLADAMLRARESQNG